MVTSVDDPRSGRARLTDATYAIDLSGKDFVGIFVDETQTLSHSFLNGASFRSCAFLGTSIDQTELAETELCECLFQNNDFRGSSFIGAVVEDTIFRNCDFSDGEWRQSRFEQIKFIDCKFNYTTMNLCQFTDCQFSGEGLSDLDNRSINYNVFTDTLFDVEITDTVVLASNWGFRSTSTGQSLTFYEKITLEEVCLKYARGLFAVDELIGAIEREFLKPNRARLKVLRLEFITNILRSISRNEMISAISLAYLEAVFTKMAQSSNSEQEMLAVMGTLLSIRSLLAVLSENDLEFTAISDRLCLGIDIRYPRTYDQEDGHHLAEILGDLATGNSNTFSVARFQQGSTAIDMIATEAVTVGAALGAINFALRQANITLTQSHKLVKNINRVVHSLRKSVRKPSSNRVSRLPTLQRSGHQTKELTALRRTVAIHGRSAVALDGKADAAITYSSESNK